MKEQNAKLCVPQDYRYVTVCAWVRDLGGGINRL